jgi:hypothetical protein
VGGCVWSCCVDPLESGGKDVGVFAYIKKSKRRGRKKKEEKKKTYTKKERKKKTRCEEERREKREGEKNEITMKIPLFLSSSEIVPREAFIVIKSRAATPFFSSMISFAVLEGNLISKTRREGSNRAKLFILLSVLLKFRKERKSGCTRKNENVKKRNPFRGIDEIISTCI